VLVSFDWQTSQARYVWVFIPRKARHASGRLALAPLSQALLLGYLLSPHSAFQEHAAHVVEWSTTLNSNGSWGTCIPQGVTTFLLRAFTAHHLNKQRLINLLEAKVNESAHLIESTEVTPPYEISCFHRGSRSCRTGWATPISRTRWFTCATRRSLAMPRHGSCLLVIVRFE
jgi:hypothetical protein